MQTIYYENAYIVEILCYTNGKCKIPENGEIYFKIFQNPEMQSYLYHSEHVNDFIC